MGIEETTLGAAIVLLYGIVLVLNGSIDQMKKAIHLNTISVRIIGERVVAATWTEGSDMPMADTTQTELMQ